MMAHPHDLITSQSLHPNIITPEIMSLGDTNIQIIVAALLPPNAKQKQQQKKNSQMSFNEWFLSKVINTTIP